MTTGVKHDAGKPRWSLLPWRALEPVVQVLEHGAAKYAVGNWKHVADAEARYLDAAFRHLGAHADGERLDPESGLPHLAHAVTNVLFLLWFDGGSDGR